MKLLLSLILFISPFVFAEEPTDYPGQKTESSAPQDIQANGECFDCLKFVAQSEEPGIENNPNPQKWVASVLAGETVEMPKASGTTGTK